MIPESQLVAWSNQGGTTNSIAAHKAIRSALEALDSPMYGRDFEIFLQGSYKNSTNIRADSDVDVVVQSNEVFYKDLSWLPADQQVAQKRSFIPGSHNAQDWRRVVEVALRKKFGSALKPGGGKAFYVVTWRTTGSFATKSTRTTSSLRPGRRPRRTQRLRFSRFKRSWQRFLC